MPGADFPAVLRRLERAATRLRGRIETVGHVDDEPIVRLAWGKGVPLLMAAGIHGEEPGAVEGLLTFLETDAALWGAAYAFEAFPCLNPFGYARHRRTNRAGKDPNRLFRDRDDPLARILRRETLDRHYLIFLDLHEDEDFREFYLYETTESTPLAPLVRGRMGQLGPWVESAPEPPISNGVVREGWVGVMPPRRFMDEASQWPLDYLLYGRNTSHVLTIETAGKLPLETRAAMQREGILAALEALASRGAAGFGTTAEI